MPASFWSTRDGTNYSETNPNPNVTNAVNALEPECPMIPNSEIPGPLPKMRCHDSECQEYLFGGNEPLNATMEKQCYIIENQSSWVKQ